MCSLLSRSIRFALQKPYVAAYTHCTSIQYSVHKMMNKVMLSERKKKHKYSATPLLLPPASISKGSYEGKRSSNSRRVDVLNKLFMRYITDLITTGDHSTELYGHGIEIRRVQVTPDFKAVHVYWICSDVEKEQEIENNLQSIAGDLRCELANLNIIGLIPKILFFKDKEYSKILRVDERLAIADFGEDHEPQQYTYSLKSELKLRMRLDERTQIEISKLECESDDRDIGEPLPEMPQNVLGLNHAAILDNIMKQMNKTTSSQISTPEVAISSTINESPIRFTNVKAQNEAFREFLVKRKILEAKAKRENKNYRPEIEYIKEELANSHNGESTIQPDLYLDDFIEEYEN